MNPTLVAALLAVIASTNPAANIAAAPGSYRATERRAEAAPMPVPAPAPPAGMLAPDKNAKPYEGEFRLPPRRGAGALTETGKPGEKQ